MFLRILTIFIIVIVILGSITFSIIAENPRRFAHPKDQQKEYLGKIISADVLTTSFNESPKMVIKTEKATIVIREITRVDIGKEAYSEEWSYGRRFFGWEGSQNVYPY
jgi:hypothetical protein